MAYSHNTVTRATQLSTSYTQPYMIAGNLSHEFFNKLIRSRAVVNALNHCRSVPDGRALRPLGYIIIERPGSEMSSQCHLQMGIMWTNC